MRFCENGLTQKINSELSNHDFDNFTLKGLTLIIVNGISLPTARGFSVFKYSISYALVAACCSAAVASSALPTAQFSDIKGKVLVNKGQGFVPATLAMTLKSGDRVLVGEDSSAMLAYEACAVVLDKPAVTKITDTAACATVPAVQPVADVYVPPGSGGAAPGAAGAAPGLAAIPPAVLFTSAAIVGVTCVVACKEIFGRKRRFISGP
jgi:hypothetical protein